MNRATPVTGLLLTMSLLLVANTSLHAWLTLQFSARPVLTTPAGTMFVFYVGFAWLTALTAFTIETQRQHYLGGDNRRRCALRLGLLGLAMPPIAMALHPDATQLGLAAWATAIATGAALGSLEGFLYCSFIPRTRQK